MSYLTITHWHHILPHTPLPCLFNLNSFLSFHLEYSVSFCFPSLIFMCSSLAIFLLLPPFLLFGGLIVDAFPLHLLAFQVVFPFPPATLFGATLPLSRAPSAHLILIPLPIMDVILVHGSIGGPNRWCSKRLRDVAGRGESQGQALDASTLSASPPRPQPGNSPLPATTKCNKNWQAALTPVPFSL